MMLPLRGLKVVELEGLAPSVFAGMVLRDFGADVTIVSKPEVSFGIPTDQQYMNRGKKSIVLDLKKENDKSILHKMLMKADIFIDCYRPGILEKLGFDPNKLLEQNSKLITCRVSGYGQNSEYSHLGGHDLNYLSQSGMLSTFGKHGSNPEFPVNILADFAGGGSYGVIGILLALQERHLTGKGQVVDVAMHEAVGYLGSFLDNARKVGFLTNVRGESFLDGGAPFYRCYECKDRGQYMAVGCIESHFYNRFLKGLPLTEEEYELYSECQIDKEKWPQMQAHFEKIFGTKTRQEWTDIFSKLDCCVTPVLTIDEAKESNLWKNRHSLMNNNTQFGPHPKLSSINYTEISKQTIPSPKKGEHTQQILQEYGITIPKL